MIRIRWANIFAAILALLGIKLMIEFHREMDVFLQGMGNMGPGSTPEDRVWGLCAFGLCAILLALFAKLILRER
jgi:hypothetical protein